MGRPVAGLAIRAPACRVSVMAVAHAAWSLPVCVASRAAASGIVGGRRRSSRAVGWRVRFEPEDLLDPAGKGVSGEPFEIVRRRWVRDALPERFQVADIAVGWMGDPLQGLADHPLRIDGCAEQRGRDPRDLLLLLLRAALGGHRRRRADALDVRRVAGVLEPSDQKRDVGALPPAVGVQLVQDEEPQALGRPDEAALVRAGQDELEHHVVGEQDVRRVGDDRLALLRRLLPGVPLEGHRLVLGAEELLELAELAVGQGIHRVDDDRLDARLVGAVRLGFEDLVNDRDDVRQALTGPGAGGEDVALPRVRGLDGLLLVPVEAQFLPVLQPEDVLGGCLAAVPGRQARRSSRRARSSGSATATGRATGTPLAIRSFNMLSDGLVVDVDEGPGELPVVLNQPIPNPKDIHARSTRHILAT